MSEPGGAVNVPFKTTLVFKRPERGRSAAHAIYAKGDDPSWEVTIFLSDLEDVIAPLYLTDHFEFVVLAALDTASS